MNSDDALDPSPQEAEDDTQQRELLGKMDALLRRHRPGAFGAGAPEDVPVLTDVVAPAGEEVPLLTEVALAPQPLAGDAGIPVLTDIAQATGVQALSGVSAEEAAPSAQAAPEEAAAVEESFAPPTATAWSITVAEPAAQPPPAAAGAEGAEEAPVADAAAVPPAPDHEGRDFVEAAVEAPAPQAAASVAEAPAAAAPPPEPHPRGPAEPTLAQFEAMAEDVFHNAVRRLDGRIDEVVQERLKPRLSRLFHQSLDELLYEVRTDLKLMTRECVHAELRARLDALSGNSAGAARADDGADRR